MSAPIQTPAHDDVADADREKYTKLLARLSALSVTHHFDAYGDIDWDATEFVVDPADPRWELPSYDPITETDWYRALSSETKARFGLDSIASAMKLGLEFERVLKQGLLEFAGTLPNGAPEFRYAYHEVIEEAQHSLMFQEFVNRSGFDAAGLTPSDRFGARFITALGRVFPPMLFIFVLGGEEPVDYLQRKILRSGRELHPLFERVMRIHVTEEARHVSFANSYLRTSVASLSWFGRLPLAIGAPIILAIMAQKMMKPSPQLIKAYDIPRSVIAEAYDNNPAHRAETIASIRRVRRLCDDMGLVTPRYRWLWRRVGLDDS